MILRLSLIHIYISSHNYGVPTFVGEFTCFEQEQGWKTAMSIFNSQGWHWTTWSYKVTGNSSWGIYNHSPQSVDIYNDSADTIKNKWSAVGTSSAWKLSLIHIYNMAAGPASYGMTDTLGRMHSDAQFAGSSSVPAHVEMMGLIGMGNNPMVGATVAVAVSVQQAADEGKF